MTMPVLASGGSDAQHQHRQVEGIRTQTMAAGGRVKYRVESGPRAINAFHQYLVILACP